MTQIASALLITRDLFFSSQIEGLARSAGVALQIAPCITETQADLDCDLIILDLELPAIDFAELAELLNTNDVHSVGYGSHVKTDLFDAAGRAGIEHLVARGRLHEHLQDLLR